MPQSTDDLRSRLSAATAVGARENLLRRGLARGMIWRNGQLPVGAFQFAESLTADLLDHGYSVLAQALRLREVNGSTDEVIQALVIAAESIESAVRRGPRDADRDFHLVVAASAFHLAHFGARAFCLVPSLDERPNLSSPERALVHLMRRSLGPLRAECARWLRDEAHQDATLAASLEDGDPQALLTAEVIAISTNFTSGLAAFVTAVERGDAALAERAANTFAEGAIAAAECRHVPLWWVNTLARHLTSDLWANSFHARVAVDIDAASAAQWRQLRNRYIAVLRARETAEIDLWPSQWEASERCSNPHDDLVVALPTSAGKTRIAELCILRALADGRRVVYVTPLRALSAQLERTLAATFRPLGHSVTALYGASGIAAADVATLRDADIVVATPEKLDFALRVEPSVLDDVGLVVLDEGHMIGLGTREIRYEVLVQRLLRRHDADDRRIVCLSAVFAPQSFAGGDRANEESGRAFDDFTAWLRNDAPGRPIMSPWRPTRQRSGVLLWEGSGGRLDLTVDGETPYVRDYVPVEAPHVGTRKKLFPADANEFVIAAAKAFVRDDNRVLVYCPQRRSVETLGEAILKAERQGFFPSVLPQSVDISRALRIGAEWLGDDHVALRALRIGVALHHGTLPRAFLSEIEDLLQRRQLSLVVSSPTLAQGIDLSCSVLIFRSIYRFRDTPIEPEEFANVVGRAGRAFVDLDGVSVFPIFEKGFTGRKRRADYNKLVRDSASRRLESGLLMLVDMLVDQLSEALEVNSEAVRAYVLDVDSAWDVELRHAIDDEGTLGDDEVAPVLAELDAAIMASVERLECTPEEIADALDAALVGSLWSRRLERRRAASLETELMTDVVVGRATWLWNRTTAASRRGYHAAGVGFATGQFLDAGAAALCGSLVDAERSLASGDFEAAASAIVAVAREIGEVAPFDFEHRFSAWEAALTAWVKGEAVAPNALSRGLGIATAGDLNEVVPFIQQDVVFRLVWGVEAVRLHGVQLGVPGAETLTGICASVLTFGCPTTSGIVLAQSGLASREMIRTVLNAFPGTFTDTQGMRDWLEQNGAALDDPRFWPDSTTSAVWAQFRRRWSAAGASWWEDRTVELQVEWLPDAAVPTAGAPVSLVDDPAENVVYVCDATLRTMGRVVNAPAQIGRGSVSAVVSARPNQIFVQSFGPSA